MYRITVSQKLMGRHWVEKQHEDRAGARDAIAHGWALQHIFQMETSKPHRVEICRMVVPGGEGCGVPGKFYPMEELRTDKPLFWHWQAEDMHDRARELEQEAQDIRAAAKELSRRGDQEINRMLTLDKLTCLCLDEDWPAGYRPDRSKTQSHAEL